MGKKVFVNKFYRAKEVNKDNSSFFSKLKDAFEDDEYCDDDFDELDYVLDDELDNKLDDIDLKTKKDYRTEKAAVTKKLDALKKDPNTLVFEPTSFDEIPQVMDSISKGKTVILNLTLMDSDQAQRAVDFIAGGTHVIDGSSERVDESIFLFAPSCIN